jgi:hypothetical protein
MNLYTSSAESLSLLCAVPRRNTRGLCSQGTSRRVCFVLSVLKQFVHDRYFFKLNCFNLICWFYHHIAFPSIRSVCYRFLLCDYRTLHCNYRKLHCAYRNLHCCLGLTALKSTNRSRIMFLSILLFLLQGRVIWEVRGLYRWFTVWEGECVSHDLLTIRLPYLYPAWLFLKKHFLLCDIEEIRDVFQMKDLKSFLAAFQS